MNGQFVNWSGMYDGVGDGFGVHPGAAGDIAELHKAMSAGDGQPTHGQAVAGGLQPLMPESLEGTLKYLTYTEKEFKLWKKLVKTGAVNTAEEYNRLHRVGSGDAAFIAEGDLPEEDDSTYSREVALVKFLGTTRRVTHVASLVKTAGIANAVAAETRNGTLWLMRQLENALWHGDSSMIPEQFDGFRKLVTDGDGIVFDNRGAPLSQELLNGLTGAARGAPNYGNIDTWWMGINQKADFSHLLYPNLREMYGSKGVSAGVVVDNFDSVSGGRQRLEDSIFLGEGQAPVAAGVGKSEKRPLEPIIESQPAMAVDTTAEFEAADAGDYIYKVVAFNRYGRSKPVTTSAVTLDNTANDRITFQVRDGGRATGYIIYRSSKNGAAATCKEMVKVVATANGVTTVNDLNADLPGTSIGFGFEHDPNTLGFKQLAPFTRLPLATIDTSIRWMQVLYGVPVLYRPRHVVMIKNIGRDPDSPVVDLAFPGFE